MWFLATTCLIELCLVLYYAFARNWSHAFMQQRIQATNRKTSIIIFECENITLVPIIDKFVYVALFMGKTKLCDAIFLNKSVPYSHGSIYIKL